MTSSAYKKGGKYVKVEVISLANVLFALKDCKYFIVLDVDFYFCFMLQVFIYPRTPNVIGMLISLYEINKFLTHRMVAQ